MSRGQTCDSVCPCPQNAIVSVKELCGLPPIASLKQCLLTLSSRLVAGDNTPSVSLAMKDTFPYLEPLGPLPDVQKKMLAAYDLVGREGCASDVCVAGGGVGIRGGLSGGTLMNDTEWLPLKPELGMEAGQPLGSPKPGQTPQAVLRAPSATGCKGKTSFSQE